MAIGSTKELPRDTKLTCGLVMPISQIDGCSADHWLEVKDIVSSSIESIEAPRFEVRLVSEADDAGVIQKRIVQNLYNSNIVVCDVSGKNPNVMFELGMRLAFDKPTVIIKDDKTDYSFDTGVIEHINYPRDLRFSRITAFRNQLADKVKATHAASTSEPSHSTFLANFGQFQVAKLSETAVPADTLVLTLLQELTREVTLLRSETRRVPKLRASDLDDMMASTIARAIARYRLEVPGVPLAQLASSPAYSSRIQALSDAPSNFASARDFRKALDETTDRLIQMEGHGLKP